MKARTVLTNIYFMFQIYVVVFMGIIYPVTTVNTAGCLLISLLSYFSIVFAGDEKRPVVILLNVAVSALASYFTQDDWISRAVMMLYFGILIISYFFNRKYKNISPIRVLLTVFSGILLAYLLRHFVSVRESIDLVYNSALSLLIIGMFASVLANIELFYGLPFVNVMSEKNREVIENIITASAFIVLLLQSQLFSMLVAALLIISLAAIYLLYILLTALSYGFAALLYVIGLLFPDLIKLSSADVIEALNEIDSQLQDAGKEINNYMGNSIDVLTLVLLSAAVVTAAAVLIYLYRKRREVVVQFSRDDGMFKSEVREIKPEQSVRKNYGRLTAVRRRYKNTVRKLINKDYEFPAHITANEYLSTIKNSDREKYDFEKLTEEYNEDRYNHDN